MCVGCTLDSGQDWRSHKLGQWRLRWYIGGLRNFVPRKQRGEGSPAPWIMVWRLGKFGVMIEASRIRPWLRPEVYRVGTVTGFMWGNLMISWKQGEDDGTGSEK